jgi:Sulfotransferase family
VGLPDVVYIGNMRCGSTFLRSFFEAHPETEWTRRAWYFQLGASDEERRQVYQELFGPVRADAVHVDMYEALFLGQYFPRPPEVDPRSLDKPVWDPSWALVPGEDGPVEIDPVEVARRVHACVPAAKILIVLREQVRWMDSMLRHYLARLPRGHRSLEGFVSTADGKAAWSALRYDLHVQPYLERFGEAVHVVFLEDLARDTRRELGRLTDFLGISRLDFEPEAGERNEGASALRAKRLRYGLRGLWKGRGKGALTPGEARLVARESVEGNRRLQGLLEVDLARLGYPLGEPVVEPAR